MPPRCSPPGRARRFGLLSPGDRPIGRGDPLTVAFGIWGALNCRAGLGGRGRAASCRTAIGDYVERLVAPYFEAVAEWYGALHVGQAGGALQEIIDRRLGDPFFGIGLNPGHQLHLDEWVSSPVWRGSTVELRSGMAMQVDIIPATGTPWFTTNIEDGIALADEGAAGGVRGRATRTAWARIEARRAFMRDALGIDLHPDVLPFSNIPAVPAAVPAAAGPGDDGGGLIVGARRGRTFARSGAPLLSSAGRRTR